MAIQSAAALLDIQTENNAAISLSKSAGPVDGTPEQADTKPIQNEANTCWCMGMRQPPSDASGPQWLQKTENSMLKLSSMGSRQLRNAGGLVMADRLTHDMKSNVSRRSKTQRREESKRVTRLNWQRSQPNHAADN